MWGLSGQVSVETEFGTTDAISQSVSVSNSFRGNLTDHTIVYRASRVREYTGRVQSSSTGVAVADTEVPVRFPVPNSMITTSDTLASFKALHPATYAAYESDLTNPIASGGALPSAGNLKTYLSESGYRSYCRSRAGFSTPNLPTNPFQGNPIPATGPDFIESPPYLVAVHQGGTSTAGTTFEISEEQSRSYAGTFSVDVELEEKAGYVTIGLSGGHTWGSETTASTTKGTSYGVSLSGIPNPSGNAELDKEAYAWRSFLCKRRLNGSGGQALDVWVLNYAIDNYQGSGGLEPNGDVLPTWPRSSVVQPVQPEFFWDQETGSTKQFQIELQAVGANDTRTSDALFTAATLAAANANGPAFSATWAQTGFADDGPLLRNQLYAWRVSATDWFGNVTGPSGWEYFVSDGPVTSVVLNASPAAPEAGQAVTLTAEHAPKSGQTYTFNLGDGRVIQQASKQLTTSWPAGSYLASVTVSGALGSAQASRTVPVAPHAVNDAYNVVEDTLLDVGTPGVLGNDGSDDLIASLKVQAQHGFVTLRSGGDFNYRPDVNHCGQDRFVYAARSFGSGSEQAEVVIDVSCVQDPPSIPSFAMSIIEDRPESFGAPGILGNASDPEGDPITAVLVEGAQHGTVTLGADGSLSYVPDEDFCGTDSFRWATSDGVRTSAPATVPIDIACFNESPKGGPVAIELQEDTPLHVDAPGILEQFHDPEGDPMSVGYVYGVGTTTADIVVAPDGSYDVTPFPNVCGPMEFTFAVLVPNGAHTDGRGTIDIACVNDPPGLPGVGETAIEDEPLTRPAPGYLLGAFDIDGDPLTAEIVAPPAHGEAEMGADGAFSYSPDADFCGPDPFTWRVSDGTVWTGPETIALEVHCLNDVPVAIDDGPFRGEFSESETLTIPAPGLLANDHDVDGPEVSLRIASAAVNGSQVFLSDDGALTFGQWNEHCGPDSFTYVIDDRDGGVSEPAVVSLEVACETRMTASPVLMSTRPDPGDTQVHLGTFEAQLSIAGERGRAIVGEPVDFEVLGAVACTGITDESGIARCTPSPADAVTALLFSYEALYGGSDWMTPSSATASPHAIDPGHVPGLPAEIPPECIPPLCD
jgi:hypothetical protein